VSETADDADEVPVVKDRIQDDHVRQVAAADPGIVRDDRIARFQRLRREVVLEDEPRRTGQRPRKDGNGLVGEADRIAVGRHDRRGGVGTLSDREGVRQPLGGVVHLVGGRLESVPQHLRLCPAESVVAVSSVSLIVRW